MVHAVTKPTVEACHSVDAGRWAREGIIAPDRKWIGSWTWRDREASEVK